MSESTGGGGNARVLWSATSSSQRAGEEVSKMLFEEGWDSGLGFCVEGEEQGGREGGIKRWA